VVTLEEEKRAARKRLATARAAVSDGARVNASALACRHLTQSEAWPSAGDIATFCPLEQEADPTALAVYAPGRVAYPQVADGELVFRDAPMSELEPVPPYGVKEPRPEHPELDSFALVVVPGLGFTKDGARIGYGRGYYDRALARLREVNPSLVAVGFGFACQLVDEIPTGPSDARLDAVVTEDGFLWTRG